MGVPKFYRWISERYPCLSEVVKEYQIPEFDNLYLDMNGIIHVCSHPNDADPHFRITEENIFESIFHYIESLFRMIQPCKVFFMAVDGVAPRAKMNQQRGRRFRSAKEAEVQEERAKERGEVLPSEERFDSNCITPGTSFMARLDEQLKYFVSLKVSTDKQWQGVQVYLSGHTTPGEGEHKIMDFIRYQKSQPEHDPNTRHCLYGLDADLIMLGLCTHEPHFSLLREEVRFTGKKSQARTQTPEETTFHLLHLSLLREYLDWEFSKLKEPGKIPFPYDLEKIIDDWVLMGFLVGNDFIPHLPDMHIVHGALPTLYRTYMEILPTLDGYINEDGYLNLERFEKYMVKLSQLDYVNFQDTYADLKYFEGKMGRKMGQARQKLRGKQTSGQSADVVWLLDEPKEYVPKFIKNCKEKQSESSLSSSIESGLKEDIQSTLDSEKSCDNMLDDSAEGKENFATEEDIPAFNLTMDSDLKDLIKEAEEFAYSSDDEDGESPDEENGFDSKDPLIACEFKQHKRDYYMNKLEYKQVTPEVMKDQAEGYVRAIQWNLHYYYNGVCSWSWYYPHHYAPYMSDIKNFSGFEMEFDMGKPFLPFEQLLAVLPAASGKLLPESYQSLMVSPDSPIQDYYPDNFKTDLNGKQQEWEAVVLIPFIDEKCLLEAMAPLQDSMTDEEKNRNKHGPMLVYTYTSENMGKYESPAYFPKINVCHAAVKEVWSKELHVELSNLKKGLCDKALLDVYFPGFPTLKHIPHEASLHKASVKVFQHPSRGENMILQVLDQGCPNISDVAQELLGKIIYVSWPHLVEARVVGVSNKDKKYALKAVAASGTADNIIVESLNKDGVEILDIQRNSVKENYMNRLGVNVGETHILVYACPMIGRKYTFGAGGQITLEKQWTTYPVNYALQLTVKDIAAHAPTFTQYKTLSEVFPAGSSCYMLDHPHYGSQGEVVSVDMHHNGSVHVILFVEEEPRLDGLRKKQHKSRLNYMPGHVAAQQLGISPHFLSRITGTMYVLPGSMAQNSDQKFNVGLNLKFNKRNEEVPGYTRKTQEGIWLYSTKAVQLLREYMSNFMEFMEYVTLRIGNDVFYEEDIFPESDGKSKVREITQWLKSQPYSEVPRQKCGSEIVEEEIVAAIEAVVKKLGDHKPQKKRVQVMPHLLYKANLQSGCISPDPNTVYYLFDRVVNVRESYTVPAGLKGTVIGIQKAEKEADIVYEVVFDKEFTGGLSIRCSEKRGYRLPPSALINLSYGLRVEQERERALKPTAVVRPRGVAFDNMPGVTADGSTKLPFHPILATHTSRLVPFEMVAEVDGTMEWVARPKFRLHTDAARKVQQRQQQQRNLVGKRWEQEYNFAATAMKQPKEAQIQTISIQDEFNSLNLSDNGKERNLHKSLSKKPRYHSREFYPQGSRTLIEPNAGQSSGADLMAPQGHKQDEQNYNFSPDLTKTSAEFLNFWKDLRKKEKVKESSGRNLLPPQAVSPQTVPPQAVPQGAPGSATETTLTGDEFLKRFVAQQNSSMPLLPVVPVQEPASCQALMQFLQSRGYGVPRYRYLETKMKLRWKAQCVLPTGGSVFGADASNKEQASENAARKMLEALEKGQVMLVQDEARPVGPHPHPHLSLQPPPHPQWALSFPPAPPPPVQQMQQSQQMWSFVQQQQAQYVVPPFPALPPNPLYPTIQQLQYGSLEIHHLIQDEKRKMNYSDAPLEIGAGNKGNYTRARGPIHQNASEENHMFMPSAPRRAGSYQERSPEKGDSSGVQKFVPLQVSRRHSKTQESGGDKQSGGGGGGDSKEVMKEAEVVMKTQGDEKEAQPEAGKGDAESAASKAESEEKLPQKQTKGGKKKPRSRLAANFSKAP